MWAVDDVYFRLGHVAAIRFGLGGIEGRFVFSPDDQQARLIFLHPGLPAGIGGDIGAVIVEKIALNIDFAGAVEKREFVVPQIGVVAFEVGIVADVARARGLQRQ